MAADKDALNYPYIRVRSVDWLKRTLLIFPHVVRMTPTWGAPADDDEIAAFMRIEGRRGPLLRGAELRDEHVYQAQLALIEDLRGRIEENGPAFHDRFGREATKVRSDDLPSGTDVWDRRLLNKTFQIHTYKLLEQLTAFLTDEDLAWTPAPELADGTNYIEMHPALGEAVMATLAMACAENEGLQVVTEFPKLHGKLLGVPRESILTASLDNHGSSGKTSGQQIAEFFVYRRCNVDLLSAEAIVDLQDEREALSDFRQKIEKLAANIPEVIHREQRLEEYLESYVDDLFADWGNTRANLGAAARHFFSEELAEKFVEKLVEVAAESVGEPPQVTFARAGAGFVVVVVSHGIKSWAKTRSAKDGPLRYLTKLQDHGVSFSVAQ